MTIELRWKARDDDGRREARWTARGDDGRREAMAIRRRRLCVSSFTSAQRVWRDPSGRKWYLPGSARRASFLWIGRSVPPRRKDVVSSTTGS